MGSWVSWSGPGLNFMVSCPEKSHRRWIECGSNLREVNPTLITHATRHTRVVRFTVPTAAASNESVEAKRGPPDHPDQCSRRPTFIVRSHARSHGEFEFREVLPVPLATTRIIDIIVLSDFPSISPCPPPSSTGPAPMGALSYPSYAQPRKNHCVPPPCSTSPRYRTIHVPQRKSRGPSTWDT